MTATVNQVQFVNPIQLPPGLRIHNTPNGLRLIRTLSPEDYEVKTIKEEPNDPEMAANGNNQGSGPGLSTVICDGPLPGL
jgi:hypothetical protein